MSNFYKGASYFSEFLQTSGGDTNLNGDYSSTVTQASLTCATNEQIRLARMIIFIQDTGTFTADKYGALAALTNGVSFDTTINGVTTSLTDGLVVQSDVCFSRYCHDTTYTTFGSGDNFFSARWTFSAAGGPIILNEGDTFSVSMNDDLTGLVRHTFNMQGFKGDIRG